MLNLKYILIVVCIVLTSCGTTQREAISEPSGIPSLDLLAGAWIGIDSIAQYLHSFNEILQKYGVEISRKTYEQKYNGKDYKVIIVGEELGY